MHDQRHTVLGAGGGAGNAIARALSSAGVTTRGVNRSGVIDLPEEIEKVAADITTPDGLTAAISDSDVVYMAAQPPYHRWQELFPAMLRGVIDACARTGAKLVMVDNLYEYGPGHDRLDESTPRSATDSKGRTRRLMRDMLTDAHRDGRLTMTIGQASDYFGPQAPNSAITALAIEPTSRPGRTLRWMGSLDALHSVAYLPDIARAYVTLGTSSQADGRAWVLPHGETPTGRSFLAIVNDQVPDRRKTRTVSVRMLRLAAPFHRVSRESLEISYQWTEPWVADDTSFRSTFGPFSATPLEVAVETAVDSHRSR